MPTIKKDSEFSTVGTTEKEQDNDKWLHYYNLKSDSLIALYAQNSIKILNNGEIIEGNEQIIDYILSDSLKLVSIKSDTLILAHKEKAIEYEISESIYTNHEKYKTLAIWQTKNKKRKRLLEFVIKTEPVKNTLEALNNRRDLWMSLCNKHDAKKLIEELYSKSTLYYNHKPMIRGRERLIDEYQYMNNENYQLSLQPEIVDRINENFIFEIGQCSGSYNGKYILIWKKDKYGKWSIFFDSNI